MIHYSESVARLMTQNKVGFFAVLNQENAYENVHLWDVHFQNEMLHCDMAMQPRAS